MQITHQNGVKLADLTFGIVWVGRLQFNVWEEDLCQNKQLKISTSSSDVGECLSNVSAGVCFNKVSDSWPILMWMRAPHIYIVKFQSWTLNVTHYKLHGTYRPTKEWIHTSMGWVTP
jgi:hypothetical protein